MPDLRLYRAAFLPALVAVVALMFSLDGVPQPLEPAVPPGAFEGERAAATARAILEEAPEREPGGAGDAAVADLVAERFADVTAGIRSEQPFEASHDGEELELRNVLVTLPGDPNRTVIVLAGRNSPAGPGAATTAAATGVLVELANVLGASGHDATYILASTPGDGASSLGARELLAAVPEPDGIEAVVVVSQPGPASPRRPFVVASSTSESTGPVQLERTAGRAVSAQTGLETSRPGPFAILARLAFPSGIGPQAPLIAAGVPAVAISAGGESPLPASSEELSAETAGGFGRAVQSTVAAVDVAAAPLEEGPSAQITVAENLVPGWALVLLALALILPAAVAAVDAGARARRGSEPLGPALAWAAAWGLPFLGALGALYALALVGLVPRPEFPFDPELHQPGLRGAIAIVLIVAAAAGSVIVLRRVGLGAPGAPNAAAAGAGAVAVAASFALWLANPYLGLLVVPAAHLWLVAAAGSGRRRSLLVAGAALAVAAPALLALGSVAAALELGAAAPWTFALMTADGQFGLGIAVPACFLAGALVAAVALAAPAPDVPEGH